jgi:hypothetical protein
VRGRQSGGGRANDREVHERVQLAVELREVRGVGVRAARDGRALVDGRVRRRADLELARVVVPDLYRVSRVPLRRRDPLLGLQVFVSLHSLL